MRIIRFVSGGRVVTGQSVDATDRQARRIDGDLFGEHRVTDEVLAVDRPLAPLVPVDILCIGLNYRDHAAETGAELPAVPMLFIKSSGTLNDPGGVIPLPAASDKVDYEGELAVVIGRACRDVPPERALDHVFGYTIGNDVSARDWQKEKRLGGGQFARGKSFDGFCPLGPAIVTADEVGDPGHLRLRTTVNGDVMQDGTTADLIFDVAETVASLSRTMTLRPGQVILTGTPAGVGTARKPPVYLRDGDVVAVEIDRLGRLQNTCRAARGA